MEDSTNTTNVVGKKSDYNDKKVCCFVGNMRMEQSKDGSQLKIPPEEKEYTVMDILTGELEKTYHTGEYSIYNGDTVKMRSESKAKLDKEIQDRLAKGIEVMPSDIIGSSYNWDEIKEKVKQNKQKQLEKEATK